MNRIFIFAFFLGTFFIPSQALSTSDTVLESSSASSPSDTVKSPAIIDPQAKQKLKEDALKLSESFRALFQDLSTMSQRIMKSAVDYIAEWIERNYEKLSKDKNDKLQLFLQKLQIDYAGLKDMSAQTLQKFLKEFQELLEQLEKDEPPQLEQASQGGQHI